MKKTLSKTTFAKLYPEKKWETNIRQKQCIKKLRSLWLYLLYCYFIIQSLFNAYTNWTIYKILKFTTKHEDNPFTLNCFMVPRTCLFIFDAGSRRLGSNFRNSSCKNKNGRFGPCFQTNFPFLMTMKINTDRIFVFENNAFSYLKQVYFSYLKTVRFSYL